MVNCPCTKITSKQHGVPLAIILPQNLVASYKILEKNSVISRSHSLPNGAYFHSCMFSHMYSKKKFYCILTHSLHSTEEAFVCVLPACALRNLPNKDREGLRMRKWMEAVKRTNQMTKKYSRSENGHEVSGRKLTHPFQPINQSIQLDDWSNDSWRLFYWHSHR